MKQNKKIYPKHICPKCGREFQPKGHDTKYCKGCIKNARYRVDSLNEHGDWRFEHERIELNSFFPGSEGHHIDETHVIYIPKELHRSIRHDLWNGINMETINLLAKEYLQKTP